MFLAGVLGSIQGLVLGLSVSMIFLVLLWTILLVPRLYCKLGFHDYRVKNALNLKDGKLWQVYEKCRRPGCGKERTVIRKYIGRF